jgi:hypothetical protein
MASLDWGGWPSFAHQSWRRPTLRAAVKSRDIPYILSLDILYSGGEGLGLGIQRGLAKPLIFSDF